MTTQTDMNSATPTVTAENGTVLPYLTRECIEQFIKDDPEAWGRMKSVLGDILDDPELIGTTVVEVSMLEGRVLAAITSKGEYDLGAFALACLAKGLVKEQMYFTDYEMEIWEAGTMSLAAQGRAMAHSWLRSDYDTFDIIAADALGEGRDVPYRVTEYGTVVGDWSTCLQFMMYLTCGEIAANIVDRFNELGDQIEAATDGKENPAEELWNELRSGLMPGTSTIH